MRKKVFLFYFLFSSMLVSASEGLWIPMLVEQQILPDMQAQGCKLTAEQIYSAEKACLTNAVVHIGNGCTGSFVSGEGLVLTNYHCVESHISKACEGGKEYLKNGFFAKSRDEEIPTTRLSATMMLAMFDVTDRVLDMKGTGLSMEQITDSITKDSTQDFQFSIEEFFSGNQYFMFKTKTYTDVRLVAFMPADIAQFGGNADNWSWPRSSADFALLRVYENNEPVQPRKSLEINTKGVKEDDFTMVIGYPAETKMYGSAGELSMIINELNPAQIAMRDIRLRPICLYMDKGEKEYQEVYAQYSSLSNYYVKWQSEGEAYKNSLADLARCERDANLEYWLEKNDSLKEQYKDAFLLYDNYAESYYAAYRKLVVCMEGLWRMKTLLPSSIVLSTDGPGMGTSFLRGEKFLDIVKKYNPELERSAFMSMALLLIMQDKEHISLPSLQNLKTLEDFAKFEDSVFNKSVFTNYDRAKKFQKKINKKWKYTEKDTTGVMEGIWDLDVRQYLKKNDALFRFTQDVWIELQTLYTEYEMAKQMFDSVNYIRQKALLEYTHGAMFPDANNTMRISYGTVKSYTKKKGGAVYVPDNPYLRRGIPRDTKVEPADSVVHYPYYTTPERLVNMTKEKPREYKANEDFQVMLMIEDASRAAESIAKIYEKALNGDSVVVSQNANTENFEPFVLNFITTCQTSGGNSGSPVLDANGYLVGLNFDRNKEGTLSDYYYDESVCRNICVDIRYILFCLEQYGKADNILKELTIRN
ncbi:MAG: S46 family peptidase [Bacteroidales bacterium]|nr:S46 family peptidase [Bacteroidales bacterium]